MNTLPKPPLSAILGLGTLLPVGLRGEEGMIPHILGLLFLASPAFAQVPPVAASVVANADPRPDATGKPCHIREVGPRRDWLQPSELRFVSCTSYDDGASVDLTLNGDRFQFEDGIHSETESFLIYQNTFPNYEFPVVDGVRFQMYSIKHSQAMVGSYYYYILRHGDRFYRLGEKPVASLSYDEASGLFFTMEGVPNHRLRRTSIQKDFYALDFERRVLSKVYEEHIVWNAETSSP